MTTVSVVTGAAGAMGLACVFALAPAVDIVLLTDIDENRLAAAAEHVEREMDTKVCTAAGNLGEPSFVVDLAARAAALGDLHSLVHSAGLSPSMAGWQEILKVDLAAVARLLDAFLPVRAARERGRVPCVGVGSHGRVRSRDGRSSRPTRSRLISSSGSSRSPVSILSPA